jgi:hypothetical protein
VERDKPKKSVGQTLPQLPWKRKRGDLEKNWIPFMKLCRNIHHSVWQLLGVEKKFTSTSSFSFISFIKLYETS